MEDVHQKWGFSLCLAYMYYRNASHQPHLFNYFHTRTWITRHITHNNTKHIWTLQRL
jgi:hypothetical protein